MRKDLFQKNTFLLAAGAILMLLFLFWITVCPVKATRGIVEEGGLIYHTKEGRFERVERRISTSASTPCTYFERENSLIYRHAGFTVPGAEDKIYLPYSRLLGSPDGKDRLFSGDGRSTLYYYGMWGILFLLLTGFFCYRKGKDSGKLTPREETFFHCFFIWMTHCLFLAVFRFQEPNTYILDSDSNGYFQVIAQILQGDLKSKGVYPVGLGILYLPFIFLLGAEKASDLTPLLPAFSSLFVLPLSFVLLYFTGRRFLGRKTALAGILFWILFSGFFFITEYPGHGGLFSPFGSFHYELGGGNAYIYKVYRLAVLGFSSLTEPFACFFTALLLFLSLYMKGGWKKGVLLGGVFGFACMVRLNCIFFAPVIFYCFCMGDRDFFRFRGRGKKEILSSCLTSLAAMAGFLLVFSFQLFLNHCYFQDPFIFPYSLHKAELYKGFQLSNVPRSAAFYFQCFAPLAGGFLAGILLTKRAWHAKGFLLLAVLPTWLFFCGLSELGQNYRFLMPIYALMSMGILLPGFFRKGSSREAGLILFLGFLLLIPVYPVKLFLPVPAMVRELPFAQWYMPEFLFWLRSWYFCPLLAGILLWACRKKMWDLGGYFIVLAVFLFFPPPTWLFGIFSALLLLSGGWIFRKV